MLELFTVDLLIIDDVAIEPMTRDHSRDVDQLFIERSRKASIYRDLQPQHRGVDPDV